MQYLLLIHGNTRSAPSSQEWATFLETAKNSGTFKGGSAVGEKQLIGASVASGLSEHIAGFMRFDSEDKQRVLDLLDDHPVVRHGGTIELCEMPRS